MRKCKRELRQLQRDIALDYGRDPRAGRKNEEKPLTSVIVKKKVLPISVVRKKKLIMTTPKVTTKTPKVRRKSKNLSPGLNLKEKKDPAAPKKPGSAFMFYLVSQRDDAKKKNPGLKLTELLKLLGQNWKELSESDKQKYQDMATKDKDRYQDEMDAYNKSK